MAKKILLADDSLTIQKVVELTFSDSDYDLICVSNGQRALDKMREIRPDLILADAVMPEKNGYEVCEAIKGDPATARIPVILLSGTFEPFDRDRAERIGADAIVSKPFDSQQLLAQVDALLARVPAASTESTPFPVPQTTAAIAIPDPIEPAPRFAPASEEAPFDTGFSAEDFTASIRAPTHRMPQDPFEEEYASSGADSAVEAFEKSPPRSAAGMEAENLRAGSGAERIAADIPTRDDAPLTEPSSWLRDEADRPAPPSNASFASSEAAETAESALDPFDAGVAAPPIGTSEARREALGSPAYANDPYSVPTDQMPTLEFPRQDFGWRTPRASAAAEVAGAATGIGTAGDSERRAATEISAQDAEALFDVGEPAAPIIEPDHDDTGAGSPRAEDAEPVREMTGDANDRAGAGSMRSPEAAVPAVPGEIEMLAQRSSIPELTQMLSSVRGAGDMTDEQIERLATRVVEKLSDRIVREIAWEVIPDMAEIVIKKRIKELESGIE